ncbi:GTP cyclohydrolase [Flavobacteriales bacterium]|nr:GTP cyclohydrolase [Flavobacteriales bacterium]
MNKFKKYSMVPMLAAAVLLTGCEKEEKEVPEEEHDHEVITNVHLIFTNVDDPSDVVEVEAEDHDGEGVEELEILDTINLDASKTYDLTFEILNAHDDHDDDCDDCDDEDNHDDEAEDMGAEIADEADEHQLFFGFTNNIFTNPEGDGNIDDASHDVVYNDLDSKGNPLGLNTSWTTSGAYEDGKFRVILMHQPGIKTSSSSSKDGDADFDLEFVININSSPLVSIGISAGLE